MSETLKEVAVDLAKRLAAAEANSAYDGFDAWEHRGEYLHEYMARIESAEKERACRLEGSGGWAVCSRCGAFVREACVTDATDYIPVRFCPSCGARVRGGDE